MSRENDKRKEYLLSQKDTLIHKRVVEIPPSDPPPFSQAPQKMLMDRLSNSKATSAVVGVIRGRHVEHLSDYFEQTCAQRPLDTAVICGPHQFTYQELDHRANRLAHFLISRGVGKGNAVGILLEHSLDTYSALLGVLKAGAAFVPLDPSFPSDLLAFIAQGGRIAGHRDDLGISRYNESPLLPGA